MAEIRIRVTIAAAVVLFALPIAGAKEAVAQSKQTLTCSFIAKQCGRECRKQASGEICKTYCSQHKRSCLETGKWTGIYRQFTGVRRK
ncbi:MAG: hypothetical protein AAFY64_05975 [Pseudomonadota bacterium]